MYTLCSSNIAENHYRQLNLFLNKPWVVDLVVSPVTNGLSLGPIHLVLLDVKHRCQAEFLHVKHSHY